MSSIRSILVIVDPTAKEQPAVAKAALLAPRFSARLDLFICDTHSARNARLARHLRESPKTPPEPLDAWLESIAEPLRRQGIEVTTDVLAADPLHTALVERVKHTCADLVIKDTHQQTATKLPFLTNTDWELIRNCPVPLLLVKPAPWSSAFRIGAAVDPGHEDDKPRLLDRCILQEARKFAQALGGEQHVIHSYIPAAVLAAAVAVPPVAIDTTAKEMEEERKARLEELTALVADYQVPAENIHLVTGGVCEALCRIARERGIDIMAMGAVSRRGLKRIMIGSTAESVLQQLPCDMLVVKSPNFAELLAL
ncbi:MAG TPA: universal stress protein [Steroidobacter sp.]|uniref:universal stress protein n=1 Tax=Steroidobacter sp. TaxID=1978227 RepID=UPI002ED98D97